MFKWLSGKSKTITSAAAIVASFSILSRFVGFIRDRILAGSFGASDTLDVYFAAFRIPDLLFQLIVVGGLSASFIPLFTKYYQKKKSQKAWELTSKILNLLTIGFAIVLIVAIIFIEPLSALVAPGFDPEKQAMLANMARIMFAAQFILSISMVYGSVLQGAKHFFLYSLAPIFYNVGIILGAVLIEPLIGPMGLAWGVVLGAVFHLFLQWIGVRTLGYRYRPVVVIDDEDVRYTLRHMAPRVMGLAVSQVNFLVMTVIASTLAVGSVTVLQFAYNLNFFAVGVVGVSFAIAAFPTLCDLYNRKKKKALIKTFSSTARQMLMLLVPATILFILLRAQVVRLVVGAGEFDWDATILTADTLAFFALTLTVQGLVFLLVRMYFARGETVAPFVFGLVAAMVHLAAAIVFVEWYGVAGLGLAYSLAVLVQGALLWLTLRRRMGSLDELRILRSVWVFIAAGAACGLITQAVKSLVGTYIEIDSFLSVLTQLLLAGGAGIIVYLVVAYLFKSQEVVDFLTSLRRKLFKASKPEEAIVTDLG